MGQAIGDMLTAAVGVAISPLPTVAVVLLLVSSRGRTNGPAFLAGWIIGVAGAGTILLLIAGGAGANDNGEPADWIGWLKLALGVCLLALAGKQWRGRPHGDETPITPNWMGKLDSFTPTKAAGAGIILSALNPKNLLLIIAGSAAISQTGIPSGEQAVALAAFTLIAAIGVAAPIIIYLALGDRSAAILDRLKTWLARNNSAIMATILLIIGVKLIGDAISSLT